MGDMIVGEKSRRKNSAGRRVIYFDVLNIVACLAVIILHCNTMVHTWVPGKNWVVALVIETVFFFAVPIFFMLTGATLFAYRARYSTQEFFQKRFSRIFVPFLCWGFIAFSLLNFNAGTWKSLAAWNPLAFIQGLLNNTIEGTYWFFYPLFAIYFAIPVISLLKDKQKVLIYAVGMAFVLQYTLPVLAKMFQLSWNTSLEMPVLGGFLFYPVLGYLLANIEIARKYRILLYFSAILSLIVKFVYTLSTSAAAAQLERLFFDYQLFTAALPAAALFIWLKHTDFSWLEKWHYVIVKISGCSFGIYLMHNLILQYFVFGFLQVPPTSVFLRSFGAILLYLGCLLLVLVLKQIPVLRKIVP